MFFFLQNFEKEIRFREGAGIRNELTNMLDTLRERNEAMAKAVGKAASEASSESSGYVSTTSTPVKPPKKRISVRKDPVAVELVKRSLFTAPTSGCACSTPAPASTSSAPRKSHPAVSGLSPREQRANRRYYLKKERSLRGSTLKATMKSKRAETVRQRRRISQEVENRRVRASTAADTKRSLALKETVSCNPLETMQSIFSCIFINTHLF